MVEHRLPRRRRTDYGQLTLYYFNTYYSHMYHGFVDMYFAKS
jgi:hypothetical protein